jgi:hypothetical protein
VTRLVVLALVGAMLGAGTAGLAEGQDGGSRPTHEREGRGRREKSRHGRTDPPPEKAASEEHTPEASGDDAEPDAPTGTDDASDTRGSYIESGGEKVKVLEFTGLDVSGRLKSPQLLYFLNRVRAEFDRPRLPHRSFIGESERSTHDKTF